MVTIILPVKNGERYISRAVVSCIYKRSGENQEWLNKSSASMIVVLDGSNVLTRAIVSGLSEGSQSIRVVSTPGVGLGRALNLGLSQVETPFVARMDADDVCLPTRVEKQIQFLEAYPEVVAVGSWVMLIDEDGDPIGPAFDRSTSHEDILDALLCRRGGVTGICHPSVMMRTEAVRKIGGYRDVKMGEDIDLFLRLAEVGRLANIPEILLQYRVHAKSITMNRSEEDRKASQQVRIEAYERLGIPLPEDLNKLMPPPPPSKAKLYRWWSRHAARHGNLKTARKYAQRLLAIAPHKLDTWKTVARSVIGYRKPASCVSSS